MIPELPTGEIEVRRQTGLDWEVRATAFPGNALAEVLRSPTSLLTRGLGPLALPELVPASVLHSLDIAVALKKPFKLERLRAAVRQECG